LKLTALILATSVIFTACTKTVEQNAGIPTAADHTGASASESRKPAFVPNEVIIKFKDGGAARGRESVFGLVQGTLKEQVLTPAMEAKGEEDGIFLIHTPPVG